MSRNALGIEVPAGGDAFDPQGDMVELGASLAGRVVVPVANAADRDALAVAVPPSPTSPLLVFRVDTGAVEASVGSGFWNLAGSGAKFSTSVLSNKVGVSGYTNVEVPAFVVAGLVPRLVRIDFRAFVYNAAAGGNYNLRVNVDGTERTRTSVAYGGGLDRVNVQTAWVLSLAPGSHAVAIISSDGAESVIYDPSNTFILSVTDIGPA